MSDFELLVDFHKNQLRQGPGSDAATRKALDFLPLDRSLPLQIADIGCGTGASSLVLAQELHGQITAVDFFPAFLEKLEIRAQKQSLKANIQTLVGSMDALPFAAESLDLIWSEGAVYIMGFEEGIQAWQKFLKPGGYLAVSEITWLSNTRPPEIDQHWRNIYPQIATAGHKIQTLEQAGYALKGYFHLSPSDWLQHYYQPMEDRFVTFLNQQQHSAEAQNLVKGEQAEIALYRQYQDYLSYGFYLAQKR